MKVNPFDFLDFGIKFHGHKCPAMPLGLKMASVAMNELNTERAKAGELFAILELGEHHCANCIADGVQIVTGCTFGKGNIIRSNKGKFGLILIDQINKKGVKIIPKGEWIAKAFQSQFMEERKNGKKPQEIDETIVNPLIEKVLKMPIEQQFNIEHVDKIHVKIPPHKWEKYRCAKCRELTVAEYGYYLNQEFLCADCAEMVQDLSGTTRRIIITEGD